MALPKLTPVSTTGSTVLPATGTYSNVTASLPYGIYSGSVDFISGAVDQVAFTYKMLGGDVLDIEITEQNVYAAYEISTLEYSYIINNHQAKNALSNYLGLATGTFDHKGELLSGSLSASLSGSGVGLRFPKFTFEYSKRVASGFAEEASLGPARVYSASITLQNDTQDYDLQKIVQNASVDGSTDFGVAFTGSINNHRISIRRVYYESPKAMWRFYGYYGGLNVVGNLYTYGQYSDESIFEVIPAWQNKLQAMAFETNLYTRASHFAYEIRDNIIRIYPPPSTPGTGGPAKMWFEFVVPGQTKRTDYKDLRTDAWDEEATRKNGADGINNYNTLPFTNLPYKNINSMGKQWVRKFALAVAKEMLAQVRGKFGSIPIPGESVTLNASDLLSQAREEQTGLKEELKTLLDELTYAALTLKDAEIAENSGKIQINVPMGIYRG